MESDNTNAEIPAPPSSVVEPAALVEPSKKPADSDGLREKVYLALVVAFLSFAGGAVGSLVSFRLEESKWRRETAFNVQKEIFAKRMELLERTIRAFNELQTLDFYKSAVGYSWLEGEDLIRSGKSAAPALDTALATGVKVKQAQAELSAVFTLDAIYFGPKTREAVNDLVKALKTTEPWWKVDGVKIQALLDSTAAELQYGLGGK